MSARRGPARGLGALLLLCLLLAGAVAVESRYPAALILQGYLDSRDGADGGRGG